MGKEVVGVAPGPHGAYNDGDRIIIILILILMTMFMVLSSWRGHCKSSPGSFDECRLSARWKPTLKPSQTTWLVSPPVGCYHPHPSSPFISITQPKS